MEDQKNLIFISHDSRDADIASAFAELIHDSTAGRVVTFRSSDISGEHGIPYGEEWYRVVIQMIDEASDVVCLLTPRSHNRPWILFEAGYAKGRLGKRVHGLLLGGLSVADVLTTPFGQVMNCVGDQDHVSRLVLQLAKQTAGCDPSARIVAAEAAAFISRVAAAFPTAPLDSPHLLHHVSLPVRDVDETAAFFRDLVGLTQRERPDIGFRVPGAWFELPNGQQLHLIQNLSATYRTSDEIDHNDCHFALRVGDLAAVYRRIREKQKTTQNPDINFSTYPHFYTLDPNKHVIEFNGDKVVDQTATTSAPLK